MSLAVLQCQGKQQFASLADAKMQMRKVMRSPRYKPDKLGRHKLEAYHCPHCRKFHFGHAMAK